MEDCPDFFEQKMRERADKYYTLPDLPCGKMIVQNIRFRSGDIYFGRLEKFKNRKLTPVFIIDEKDNEYKIPDLYWPRLEKLIRSLSKKKIEKNIREKFFPREITVNSEHTWISDLEQMFRDWK